MKRHFCMLILSLLVCSVCFCFVDGESEHVPHLLTCGETYTLTLEPKEEAVLRFTPDKYGYYTLDVESDTSNIQGGISYGLQDIQGNNLEISSFWGCPGEEYTVPVCYLTNDSNAQPIDCSVCINSKSNIIKEMRLDEPVHAVFNSLNDFVLFEVKKSGYYILYGNNDDVWLDTDVISKDGTITSPSGGIANSGCFIQSMYLEEGSILYIAPYSNVPYSVKICLHTIQECALDEFSVFNQDKLTNECYCLFSPEKDGDYYFEFIGPDQKAPSAGELDIDFYSWNIFGYDENGTYIELPWYDYPESITVQRGKKTWASGERVFFRAKKGYSYVLTSECHRKFTGNAYATARIDSDEYKDRRHNVKYTMVCVPDNTDEEWPVLDNWEKRIYCKGGIKPELHLNRRLLTPGVDCNLECSQAVGPATMTIEGIGSCYGKLTIKFYIIPKGTSITKVKAAKKSFTLRWKKQAVQTDGYQIQYGLKRNFKGAKTITVKSNKTVSKKIKKLKSKRKYYVRIRTYKTVNGKKYYSYWSAIKTIKTK